MTAQSFIPWKPDSCACGSRHPCFSLTGPQGPWRCHSCHHAAIAEAVKDRRHDAEGGISPVAGRNEGLLL